MEYKNNMSRIYRDVKPPFRLNPGTLTPIIQALIDDEYHRLHQRQT